LCYRARNKSIGIRTERPKRTVAAFCQPSRRRIHSSAAGAGHAADRQPIAALLHVVIAKNSVRTERWTDGRTDRRQPDAVALTAINADRVVAGLARRRETACPCRMTLWVFRSFGGFLGEAFFSRNVEQFDGHPQHRSPRAVTRRMTCKLSIT